MVAAALPYLAIVPVLAGLLPGRQPLLQAVAHAALLAAAMTAHAACYVRWRPHAPRPILVNELLARAWFGVYSILVADFVGRPLQPLVATLPAWVVGTWLIHRVLVQRRGYRMAENVLQLGAFLLGLTVLLRWA